MASLFRQDSVKVDEENPYWISFSDLMSGLLVIFILTAVALIIELTEKSNKIDEQLASAELARRNILNEIKSELEKHNIEVLVNKNETILRIPERTLSFATNSDEIPRAAQQSVKIIGRTIHRALNVPFDSKNKKILRYEYLDTVFIEGHTDSRKSKRKKGNWGLSTYRAISLWEFWQKHIDVTPTFGEMVNSNGIKLFSVSGYAATRKIEEIENTSLQRRANRRIDIRFTIRHPSLTKLKEIMR